MDAIQGVRVFGLTRASTLKQEDSPELQRYRIGQYVEKERLGSITILDEPLGTSGVIRFRHRIQGRWILQNLHAGDILIVTDLDRIGRNAADILDTADRLKKMGAKLVVLQFGGMDVDVTTDFGRMTLMYHAMGAEWERKRIRDRTHYAIMRKKELGTLCVRGNFGQKKVPDTIGSGCHWEWDDVQMDIIVELVQRRKKGHTIRTIAEDFWKRGLKDHRGLPWGAIENDSTKTNKYANYYRIVSWFHRAIRKGHIPYPWNRIGDALPKTLTDETRKYTLKPREPKPDPRDSWSAEEWKRWAAIECPDYVPDPHHTTIA